MVRSCLTVLTVAASLWSKVWALLALREDGSAGQRKTLCRHLANEVQDHMHKYDVIERNPANAL